jgi:hypothetical protein
VKDDKNFLAAIVWLFAFSSLLMVSFGLGLYYAIRRWSEDWMRVALLFTVAAAIFWAISWTPVAAVAAYIVPAWTEAGDEASRAIVLSDAKILMWTADAMTSLFFATSGIATAAAGLVMLRIEKTLWLVLGWIGIASGLISIIGAFSLAEQYLDIANFASFGLALVWFLGVGVGLRWHLPSEGTETAS